MKRNLVLLACFSAIAVSAFYLSGVLTSGDDMNGRAMVEVNVPPLDASTKLGERLFNENCAICHGENAAGKQGIAPPLVHKIYEPSHHADGSFYLAVSQGVRAHHWPFGDMPPVQGLTQGDVGKIVAYIRLVQRTNGIQ